MFRRTSLRWQLGLVVAAVFRGAAFSSSRQAEAQEPPVGRLFYDFDDTA